MRAKITSLIGTTNIATIDCVASGPVLRFKDAQGKILFTALEDGIFDADEMCFENDAPLAVD